MQIVKTRGSKYFWFALPTKITANQPGCC